MKMHMGHVALRVPDPDAYARHVTLALGLRETQRAPDEILLSANHKHHELQLIRGEAAGLDHVGLEVESAADVEAVAERAREHGAQVLEDPVTEMGIGHAVRFVGPAGIVHEVYEGMDRRPLTIDVHLNPLIRKFGHLTFFSTDAADVVAFWRDALGFRISDTAEGLTWLRCDEDHHGLAVGEHPELNVLHHHAWEVQDLSALGQYCDNIGRSGLSLFWGPVRHGPGFNLATYLPDVLGGAIEVYTDLLRIADDRAYEPIDWSDEPRALNLWGPPAGEDLLAAGVPLLAPVGATSGGVSA